MPPMDEEIFLDAMKKLVILEKDWIPRGEGTSLIYPSDHDCHGSRRSAFIRPMNISFLLWSDRWELIIRQGFHRQRFLCRKNMCGRHRAVQAISRRQAIMPRVFMPAALPQIWAILRFCGWTPWKRNMWKKWEPAISSSVIGDELITPPLTGTILPGVTRNSVIQLAVILELRLWNGRSPLMKLLLASKKAHLRKLLPREQRQLFHRSVRFISAEKNI